MSGRRTGALIMAAAASAGVELSAVRAAFVVGQDGELKVPRVEIMAYTGVPMQIKGFKLPIVIDLDGLAVTRQSVPLLKDHNPALIVGHTDTIMNDRRTLKVSGPISGAGAVAREIIDAAKAGFPWQASVTASVLAVEEVRRGQRVNVNGRDMIGPILIARASKLKEVSLLAMGADDQTSAAIAAANSKETAMNFEQWLQRCGINKDTLTEDQIGLLQAAYNAEQATVAAAGADGDGDGDVDLEAADEDAQDGGSGDAPPARTKRRSRKPARKPKRKARTVRAAAPIGDGDADGDADAGHDDAGADADGDADDIEASDGGMDRDAVARIASETYDAKQRREAMIRRRCSTNPTIMARAISEGWSVQRAEAEMFRTGSPAPAIHSPGDRRASQNVALVLEAALCRTAQLGDKFLESQYPEQVLEAADHASMRGISLHGLVRHVLNAANMREPQHSFSDNTIRAAFIANNQLQASAPTGFSTVSLTGILGNVANKSLLESFLAVDSVAEKICRIGTVNNFQRHTRYRLTGRGGFQRVGKDGELKHHGLQDETYGVQAHTAGELLVITREDMINDDLGALTSIAASQGHDAAVYREELVFTLLLDNSDNFFSNANGNLIEGTDTVLSIPAVQQAEALMLDQTDANGKPVMIEPKMLLVPNATKTLAWQIWKDVAITQFNDDGVARPASNPFAGRFEPLASPYMNNAAIAGGSSTHWFMFADPRKLPAIELAYLRGQRTPTLQQGETSFNTLGMAWRAFMDIGAEKQDPRGAVRATGVVAA